MTGHGAADRLFRTGAGSFSDTLGGGSCSNIGGGGSGDGRECAARSDCGEGTGVVGDAGATAGEATAETISFASLESVSSINASSFNVSAAEAADDSISAASCSRWLPASIEQLLSAVRAVFRYRSKLSVRERRVKGENMWTMHNPQARDVSLVHDIAYPLPSFKKSPNTTRGDRT